MSTISDQRLFDALLNTSFPFFRRVAFAELEGGAVLDENWHLDAIEHVLDQVGLGHLRRLIVTMPPRHLKSLMISVMWVAWMLGLHPDRRFMCVSYGQDLAEDHAALCLQLIQTDWYQRAFPGMRLRRKRVMDFKTYAGGGRLSSSVSGGITGRGAHHIILDDPMKAHDATYSENARGAALELYDSQVRSRLENQEKGTITLVMQRLHEADLAGELMRRDGWRELRLAAIAQEDELIPLTRGRFHQRREGRALHPARQSLVTLREIQAENSYVFASQYLQDPVARIGAFVAEEDFLEYEFAPISGTVVMSCDTAVKATVRNDWSVAVIARYWQGRYYILDVMRRRLEYGDLKAEVFRLCRQYGVQRLLIEDASSGSILISEINRDPPAGVPLAIPVKATVEKIARFEAQASQIKAGAIVLPKVAHWKAELVGELTKFPGRFDDQADAIAQMLANPPRKLPTNAGPYIVGPGFPSPTFDYDRDPWAGR